MTLDQLINAVCEAAQPNMDCDTPQPDRLMGTVAAVKQLFAEQPNIEQAFVAIAMRIATEARKGYVKK